MKSYGVAASIAFAAVCVTRDADRARTGVAQAFSLSPSVCSSSRGCSSSSSSSSSVDGKSCSSGRTSLVAALGRHSDDRCCSRSSSSSGTALRVSAPIDVYSAPPPAEIEIGPKVRSQKKKSRTKNKKKPAAPIEVYSAAPPAAHSPFATEELGEHAPVSPDYAAAKIEIGPKVGSEQKKNRKMTMKKKPASRTTTLVPKIENSSSGGIVIESRIPTQTFGQQTFGTRRSSKEKSESKRSTKKKRLTREEETQISDAIRALRSAVRVRDELADELALEEHGHDPTEEEWAEACEMTVPELRRILNDGQEARTKLVAANVGLVMSIARKHHAALKQSTGASAGGSVGTILTLQDMVQEGNLGLMEAAERFEPSRGFRFSTYASYWIRQRILRSIADSSRVIRLPAHVHSMLSTIRRAQKEMEKEIGRPPSMPELAQRLDMPLDKLQLYTDSSRSVLSLEVPLNGNAWVDDKRTLGDRIASRSPTPADDAESDALRRDVRTVVMEELADRERDVLVARFGLDGSGSPALSTEETAKRLGISRDRVRTVEARALNKLRHPRRNYRLKEYVGGGPADEEAEPSSSPENLWSF